MKSETALAGIRTNLPTFTYRIRRSNTHRLMKRTETARASAASAFVSSRSSSGAPPRARRASPPLASSTARVDRPPTPRYRPPLARRAASSCRAGSARGRSKWSAPHTCTRGAARRPPALPAGRREAGGASRRETERRRLHPSRFMALPAATYPRLGMADAVVPIAKPPRAVDSDAAVTDPWLRLPARRWGACGDRPAAPVVAPRPTQIGSPRLAEPRCRPPISASTEQRTTGTIHLFPFSPFPLDPGTSGATVFVARPRALALLTYAIARTLNLR